jgi:hypothetical protein
MNVRDTILRLQTVIDDLSHYSAETDLTIQTDKLLALTNTMKVEDKDGKVTLTIDEAVKTDYYDDINYYGDENSPVYCMD